MKPGLQDLIDALATQADPHIPALQGLIDFLKTMKKTNKHISANQLAANMLMIIAAFPELIGNNTALKKLLVAVNPTEVNLPPDILTTLMAPSPPTSKPPFANS